MIYAEEKEPPSRSLFADGVVRLTAKALFERRAARFSRFFPAQPAFAGVLSE